ncbi:MAG: Ketol-acid reductoisomerase (NAD(+)) [Chlamydiae bacterium]|nr:Ketol-acid reductoisomerase (NAD(+)) [Chlamydiota bacterium]
MHFKEINEDIVTRDEFSLKRAQEVLSSETIAVIGYGVQGPGQALNMKDNGVEVIIGQRKPSSSWDKALKDGWEEGKDLFEIDEALEKASIIMYLLSDAGQKLLWPKVKPHLTKGKALYFSHGFAITYKDQTDVIPPKDVDVFLVAPKGPGGKVRELFLKGAGVNSSFAIFQDATGKAKERCLSIGIALGSGFLFPTTFKKEVYSDLTGERGILMGAIAGAMEAQYQVLRSHGHSPSEAFNETVEEATQSLYPLIGENGMDWMFANCSTTAQRGAFDWRPKFKKALLPVFEELYQDVESGKETELTLKANSDSNYKKNLEAELKEMSDEEIWRAGKIVRSLRPERQN